MATISQPAVVTAISGEQGALIQIEDVHKYYDLGETRVHALRGVTLQIGRGEFAAIMGASGSGKSTFMNIVGCLDKPSTGRYLLEGIEVSRLTKNELAAIRNRKSSLPKNSPPPSMKPATSASASHPTRTPPKASKTPSAQASPASNTPRSSTTKASP